MIFIAFLLTFDTDQVAKSGHCSRYSLNKSLEKNSNTIKSNTIN